MGLCGFGVHALGFLWLQRAILADKKARYGVRPKRAVKETRTTVEWSFYWLAHEISLYGALLLS